MSDSVPPGDRLSSPDVLTVPLERVEQLEVTLKNLERRYQRDLDERQQRHAFWAPIGTFSTTLLLVGGLVVMGGYQYLLTQQLRVLTERQETFEVDRAAFLERVDALADDMSAYRALQPETLQANIERVGAIADRRHASLLELAQALQTFMARETELLETTPGQTPVPLDGAAEVAPDSGDTPSDSSSAVVEDTTPHDANASDSENRNSGASATPVSSDRDAEPQNSDS